MYRAVCLYALKNDIMKDGIIDEESLIYSLDFINVSFSYNDERAISETFLNGINVENEIRSLWVSENVSKISKLKEVRKKMVFIQQAIGEKKRSSHGWKRYRLCSISKCRIEVFYYCICR